MAADRGAFIDQSQSLNIHMQEPTMGKITSMHFAGWKLGLKTGMYYLRTQAASAPIQFTVDQEALKVVDTNVSKERSGKKIRSGYTGGASAAASAAASPQPEAASLPKENGAPNGAITPAQTPPPTGPQKRERKWGARTSSAVHQPTFPADQEEAESPPMPPADGISSIPKGEELPAPAVQDGAKKEEEQVGDIYAEAALACSIENPESCLMCSG
jgi:ribonucleoside-diphosphate reductase subunit M1